MSKKKIVAIPNRPDLRGIVIYLDYLDGLWLKVQRKSWFGWRTIASGPMNHGLEDGLKWCLYGEREAYEARRKAESTERKLRALETLEAL